MSIPEYEPTESLGELQAASSGLAVAVEGSSEGAFSDAPSDTSDTSDTAEATARRTRLAFALTAATALASLAWVGVSQLISDVRSVSYRGTAGSTTDVTANSSDGAAAATPEVHPPFAAAVEFQFLPKAPSTNHLLAEGKVPVRTISLPRVEVAAPVAKPPAEKPRVEQAGAPQMDPRHAAAVAAFAARIADLDKQRTDLVRRRVDTLAEKTRLGRMLEQGKLDLERTSLLVVEHEAAIALVDAQIDSYQDAALLPPAQRRQTVRDAVALYPRLTQQRAQLIIDLSKHRADVVKIRVRSELTYKQLQMMPSRIEQIGKQGEFLRRQWLRETFDWYGRRTRAEHEAAAAIFTKAIDADRANFVARLGRAVSYVHLGRQADALTELSMADDRENPFRAEAVALRGYLKVLEGDDARGMNELGQAVTYDRRSLVPLLLRGQAAARLRRYPAALADFRAAVQIDGTDPDARRLLALYHAAADYGGPRNLRESEGAAKQAVDLTNQNDWQALLALAAAEADAGRFQAAAEHAAEAAELTYDTHRDRCRELENLFAAGTPLRLEWTLAGK